MANYDEHSVLRELKQKRSITIKGNKIEIDKDATDIGTSTWGKIDFLCNHCGYTYIKVEGKSSSNNKYNDNEEKRRKPKAKERFSMSKMVKNAMK